MKAGKIDRDWWDAALTNTQDELEVLSWFCAALNTDEVHIDAKLSVWANGGWLDQERINELCRTIDAGV